MNQINVTPVIEAVIMLISIVLVTFVIPWVKSKTTAAQRAEMVAWAKIAVAAAEQIYSGVGRGEEKKNYVLDFLMKKGFTLDTESINNAIEAAVKQLNSEGIVIE